MKIEEAKNIIKGRYADYLQPARHSGYVCPLCNNGTGETGDGLSADPKRNKTQLHCYKCGFDGDLIDIYCKEHDCDFVTAVKELAARFDIVLDDTASRTHDKPRKSKAGNDTTLKAEAAKTPRQELTESAADFTEYYKECAARIGTQLAKDYLQVRGLSQDTAARYWLGYDDKKKLFIIPASKSYYVARSVYGDSAHRYYNPPGAAVTLFNTKALYNEEGRPVFITEGAFDALAIIEAGGQAAALNSTSNTKLLIKALEDKRTSSTLILSLDNDEGGQRATAELEKELTRLNISYTVPNICGKYKDANDALLADRNAFKENIAAAERATTKPHNVQDYIRRTMASEIESLKAQSGRKTGFKNIDAELYSLYPGLYVLGAVSSLGKTTFLLQLCDQMAAAGEHVIFFSLEQSRLELVSKSFSRYTAIENPAEAVNSLSIRTGYKPPIVERAIERYINDVGDRVQIIEGNFYCTADYIEKYTKRYIESNGTAPVVIIDYLQVLQSDTPTNDPRAVVESNIKSLKRMSRSLNVPVIVVSSVNRQNYTLPIDFESFKESGLIEFTADFVAGLQLSVIHDQIFDTDGKVKQKREEIRKAQNAVPRDIEFVALKNRFGKRFSCTFKYYPQYELYKPIEEPDPNANPYSNAINL